MIASRSPEAVASGSLNVAGTTLGSKFSDVVLGQRTKLEQMTKRWERREMSNFDCELDFPGSAVAVLMELSQTSCSSIPALVARTTT